MVGRVNVAGSKIKNISGTFTASNSSSQTSLQLLVLNLLQK